MQAHLGRKITHPEENPFDNVVIDIAEWLNTYIFRPLNYTPNMITTMSLIMGLASALLFHYQYYLSSIILFITAYILDCADGNYARTYNMETSFGDYYDHISDVSKIIALVVVIIAHKIPQWLKVMFIIGLVMFAMLSMFHLGCQETIYNPDGSHKYDSLSSLKQLCGSSTEQGKKYIIYSRYVGVGTLMLYCCLVIFVTMILKNT
jgi:hypothetical protein